MIETYWEKFSKFHFSIGTSFQYPILYRPFINISYRPEVHFWHFRFTYFCTKHFRSSIGILKVCDHYQSFAGDLVKTVDYIYVFVHFKIYFMRPTSYIQQQNWKKNVIFSWNQGRKGLIPFLAYHPDFNAHLYMKFSSVELFGAHSPKKATKVTNYIFTCTERKSFFMT